MSNWWIAAVLVTASLMASSAYSLLTTYGTGIRKLLKITYAKQTQQRYGTSIKSSSSQSYKSGNHFQYLVIGGGSGGIASARRAARYGVSVGLIEKRALGGTCVNLGCVPKKVMYNAGIVSEIIRHSGKHFGFSAKDVEFDWKALVTARNEYIHKLNEIYSRNLQNSKVTVIRGEASIIDQHSVRVGDEVYIADNILIATGGKPKMPNIPGIEHCISSDGFFALETQPMSMAVVGGGYIGVEIAGVMSALGTKTHLVTRGDKPLRGFDDLIVQTLMKEMKKQGISHLPNEEPVEIIRDPADNSLRIATKSGAVLGPFDKVLFATGRSPNTDRLGLQQAGVLVNPNTGHVLSDSQQATSVPSIFALGDVCGRVELTPVAIAAGRRLADRLFHGKSSVLDYENVPTVVFSHPAIGVCGLTEEAAVRRYGKDNIKVYSSTFTNLFYGTFSELAAEDKPKTSMKLVTLLPEEKLLGVHVIGMGADEMLQGFAVALKMGATKHDLDECVAIHPTASEELVTMDPWGTAPPWE